MAYRAQRPSLSGEIGTPHDDTTVIDYGRLIDAVTSGASSLIQQSYLRRIQEQQLRQQNEDRAYQRTRDVTKDTFDRDKFEHEKTMDKAELLAKGYDEKPHKRKVPNIAKALAGVGGIGQPDELDVTQTEPHYDLERSVEYRTATDRARITAEAAAARQTVASTERATLQADRLAEAQKGREFMAQAARSLVLLRAKVTGGGAARAMTGNALETAKIRAAEGLLARVNGSYDRAVELLNENGPEAESFRKIGVEARHLSYAHSQLVRQGTTQAISAQTRLGESPEESATRVQDTRTAVAGATTGKPKPKKLTRAVIEERYQNAIKLGADPKLARQRRDSLLKTVTP